MNKVFLIGHFGKDPILKDANTKFVTWDFATNHVWYKDNVKQEKTTWHQVIAFAKTMDIVVKYCKKGSKILIEGYIDNYRYEKDGQNLYGSRIIANNVQLLDAKEKESFQEKKPHIDDNHQWGGHDYNNSPNIKENQNMEMPF